MQVNFISSKGIDEDCVIHLKSDNIEIMRYDETDEVIGKRFKSIPPSYQIEPEKSTKVVISFLIVFIYCITNVIKNLNCGGFYIDSLDSKKKKQQ